MCHEIEEAENHCPPLIIWAGGGGEGEERVPGKIIESWKAEKPKALTKSDIIQYTEHLYRAQGDEYASRGQTDPNTLEPLSQYLLNE